MKLRRIAVCLVFALYLCGCQKENIAPPADNTTTTTTTTSADHTETTSITTTSTDNHSITTSGTVVPSDDNNDTLATSDTATKSKVPSSATTLSATATSSTTTTRPTSVTSSHTTSTATAAEQIVFTATVRDNKQQPVSGVTVTVYAGSSVADGVTDQKGVARIPISPDNAYRVVLSHLPAGYTAAAEYRFSGTKVNITVQKSAVQNELDHSEAAYEAGMTMGNFTLTDADGNTYRFSELKDEKKLIVLNFWYVNCTFCVAEFPAFQSAVTAYGDDVILLAVTPYDQDRAILSFREQYKKDTGVHLTFPLLRDTCHLTEGFEVTGFPTTVFITADGVIQNIHKGYYPDSETLCNAIKQYID